MRLPLTLPPNFSLRPGDENEEVQSISSVDSVNTDAFVSDQVLTSSRMGDGSVFDTVLGIENRVVGIRDLVDQETLGIQIDRRLPTDILFGGQPNVGPNLDVTAIRIRRALKKVRQSMKGDAGNILLKDACRNQINERRTQTSS